MPDASTACVNMKGAGGYFFQEKELQYIALCVVNEARYDRFSLISGFAFLLFFCREIMK